MLFAWMGLIKPGADLIPPEVNQQTSDFLQQPYMPIHFAGPLCENDRRAGMLLIFEADDRAAAEALVGRKPLPGPGCTAASPLRISQRSLIRPSLTASSGQPNWAPAPRV